MAIKKTVISVILLLSLSLSLVCGGITSYATEASDISDVSDASEVPDASEVSDIQDAPDSSTDDPTALGVPDSSDASTAPDVQDPAQYEIQASVANDEYDDIEQFVARLYLLVLGRPYDTEGLQNWSNILRDKLRTGASVAFEFFFSPEFMLRDVSNGEYVDILYRTLLDREADTKGREDWVTPIYDGVPRENIFASFVHSIEFDIICTRAGIERGTYTPPARMLARVFVARLYRTALERPPDPVGLQEWSSALEAGIISGESIAFEFLFCLEMELRNLSEENFVRVLYNSMLGREPDPEGLAGWTNVLLQGASRFDVFTSFVNSVEFGMICDSHGIIRRQTGRGPAGRALAGKVIILDPGHGTIGSPGAAGYNEAVAMLGLARRIRPLLEAQGAEVIMTRDSETNIHLAARCAQINIRALEAVRNTYTDAGNINEIDRLIGLMQGIIRAPVSEGSRLMNTEPFNASRTIHPDLRRVFEYQDNPVIRDNFLVISLHSNATANGSTTVRGGEAYYISPGEFANTRTYYPNYTYTWESWRFGDIILNNIDGLGIPRRTHGLRAANYMMIREINVPAVLVENGFHTNPSDRLLLSNPEFMDRLADAYLHAILSYFR